MPCGRHWASLLTPDGGGELRTWRKHVLSFGAIVNWGSLKLNWLSTWLSHGEQSMTKDSNEEGRRTSGTLITIKKPYSSESSDAAAERAPHKDRKEKRAGKRGGHEAPGFTLWVTENKICMKLLRDFLAMKWWGSRQNVKHRNTI